MKNSYTPAYPSFAILKWGIQGYSLHGHVFLMMYAAGSRHMRQKI